MKISTVVLIRSQITRRLIYVCLLQAIVVSCSNPEGDLKKAEQANTEQAYSEFIKKHPDSPLVTQAQAALEKVVFTAATREGNSPAFQGFLSRFPKSPLVTEAQVDLENAEYEEAKRSNTANAYQTFLDRFPNGKHVLEATENLALLVWNDASRINTISAYQSFLGRFGATASAPQASNVLVQLEYRAATNKDTVEDYQEFLHKYPNCKFSVDVNKRLQPIKLLDGSWDLSASFPNAGIVAMEFDLELKQAGSNITGSATGLVPVRGTIIGHKVNLTETLEGIPSGVDVLYVGTAADDNTINGTVNFPQYGAGTWTAKRK
jgi:outer membrane protein assembly factor BamD (BamD/ComL family)